MTVTHSPVLIRALNRIEPTDLQLVVRALAGGGLIVLPTDTVYGLACSADIPEAEERIYAAKARDARKPIPLLAAGVEDILRFGAVMSDMDRRLADAFWPGPLTLVLKARGRTEGFRVPDHGVARAIIATGGGVLRATSANLSGEPPALDVAAAVRAVGPHIELVVDGGPAHGGVPSTVAGIEDGTLRIFREGALSREALEEACGTN